MQNKTLILPWLKPKIGKYVVASSATTAEQLARKNLNL